MRQIRLGEQTQGDIVDLTTLATDTALVLAPDGTGGVEFRAGSGGGSDCDHQHESERFVALGGTPETVTIGFAPLWGVRAHVQGLRADPSDVTVAGLGVSLDTSTDDVLVIDYERACAGPLGSGVIQDGDEDVPGTFGNRLWWYYVSTEAEFAAQTPAAWAADTLYDPGAIITESGFLFARFPTYPRSSDILANEPDFGSVLEGGYVFDLNGLWMRLPDSFDVTDTLPAWAPLSVFTYGLDDFDVYYIAVPGVGVFCSTPNGAETAVTEPVWPTDPCAGRDSFWGYGQAQEFSLARDYVPGSLTGTLNGTPVSPGDLTELYPAFVGYTLGTIDDVLVISYTAVCP